MLLDGHLDGEVVSEIVMCVGNPIQPETKEVSALTVMAFLGADIALSNRSQVRIFHINSPAVLLSPNQVVASIARSVRNILEK